MLGRWLETESGVEELGWRGELWSPQHPDGVESVGLAATSRGAGRDEEEARRRRGEESAGETEKEPQRGRGKPGEPGVPEVREESDSEGGRGVTQNTLDS